MIYGVFKLWWFPERSRSWPNKHNDFLGLQKAPTFAWYPTIFMENLGHLNKQILFLSPNYTIATRTTFRDPPLNRFLLRSSHMFMHLG